MLEIEPPKEMRGRRLARCAQLLATTIMPVRTTAARLLGDPDLSLLYRNTTVTIVMSS